MGPKRRTPLLVAVFMLLGMIGCSGKDHSAAKASPPAPSETRTDKPAGDPGQFPSHPDREFDLRGSAEAWELPAAASVGADGLTLAVAAKTEATSAAAPVTVEPGPAGVMVEADIVLPHEKDSGAGVWCRGDVGLHSGYAFVVGREGGWGVFRYDSGSPVQLKRGGIDPSELEGDAPMRLRLACGKPAGGVAVLGIAYGDAPFALITDREAPTPSSPTRIGVLVTRVPASSEETKATATHLTFRYAKAP
ncbi:MAG TPA: hypothetical protein VF711_08715 [Acidimicrobiales bacterium]|jgi:hypothetical protein